MALTKQLAHILTHFNAITNFPRISNCPIWNGSCHTPIFIGLEFLRSFIYCILYLGSEKTKKFNVFDCFLTKENIFEVLKFKYTYLL